MSVTLQTDSSELLDIVDANDNVVGSATRGEIHQRGLKHRSVHVLVFDGEGRVLLQKRSMQKDQCGGMWDTSCAGHVESGQTYEKTAPRELQEELGFTPADTLQTLFKMSPTSDNGHEFAMVYSLNYSGPFTAAEDEIDELQWYTFQALDEWIVRLTDSNGVGPDANNDTQQELTSGFMEIWRRFREQDA